MPNLRLLKFYVPEYYDVSTKRSKEHLDQGLEWLPKKLRCLHWHQYPFKTLPFHFKPKNLIELNLPYSRVVQLWEGKKKAFKLKSIDLTHSQYFTRMWDPSETPNLERTKLLNCVNLAYVPSSIHNFNHLSVLCFKGCKSLRSIPRNLQFVCQVNIDFSSCSNLTEFPKISGKIKKLALRETAIEEVPSSIELLTDLQELHLSRGTRLKMLSTSICKLKCLLELYLDDCLNLENFPEILEKMEDLKDIYLHRTAITKLPSSIENLEGLERLSLDGCSKLDYLPDNIGNLKSLGCIFASGSAHSQLSASVADSNKLKELYFSGCRGLVSLPRLFLSGLSSLVRLDFRGCAVMEIPQDIGRLSSLVELNLSENNFESLPASIKQLSQLRWLELINCNMLKSLPELPLGLRYLHAWNCMRLQSLPEISSCLEELDTSILERLFKHSFKTENPSIRESSLMELMFANCMKLNETENKKILADSQLRIQHMATASLRRFYEEKFCELKGPSIFFPGSKIPEWFSNQIKGSSITIPLPPPTHSCRNLIGFGLCAVIDIKQVPSDSWGSFKVRYRCDFAANTLSETKHVDLVRYLACIPYFTYSDHVILGFHAFVDCVLPDGNHHSTISFEFFAEHLGSSYKVKYCGVSPVYANPNETKPNTFTLKFTAVGEKECTEIRNLADED